MENKKSEAAMLAINRFIAMRDLREAKMSKEFPMGAAIKMTLYIEANVILIAFISIGSKHVPFWSALRENSKLLLTNITDETGRSSDEPMSEQE